MTAGLIVVISYFVSLNFDALSFAARHPDVVREAAKVYGQKHQEADQKIVEQINGQVKPETVEVILPKGSDSE